MILNKPTFWDNRIGIISIILVPFSLIIVFINFLKKKLIQPKKFNIPIICVGNIYLGGTGKTPTSILLANELKKLGHIPAILRKYYKSHLDEHRLIEKKFKNFIIHKNRVAGISYNEKNFDSIIMDDGFQDYSIRKDLNIICFNNNS